MADEKRTKQELKDVADYFYREEEVLWANVYNMWYRPQGAPGRLSEDLLEQYHRTNKTGAIHPSDRRTIMVKVLYDERSYTIKNFLTKFAAVKYIENLQGAGIVAEIVDSDSMLASIMGRF